MSLDDKLRQIQGEVWYCLTLDGDGLCEQCEKQLEQSIAQIKQAFAEAGWLEVPPTDLYRLKKLANPDMLTGPEWLERFELALFGGVKGPLMTGEFSTTEVLEAAKRASSGLNKKWFGGKVWSNNSGWESKHVNNEPIGEYSGDEDERN